VRVLILHRMMIPKRRRKSVETLELSYFNELKDVDEVIVWNCVYKLPKPIKYSNFDAVILMSTFLGFVNFPRFISLMDDYISVLKKIKYKVALPQDEYYNPLLRDKFYMRLNNKKFFEALLLSNLE
jgi:hypothetical protein